ncbi:hypothetical protein [Hymenobacter glacieicola]|uniref:SH3b domain-containing protein n=1 Tax=Hymenobacter glacieicola TaxID=1562124 RepID=A0ABQ1WRE9_9BACT|nr:hypothetical protein [Hymenobacter glacieicola]GGG40738.1 hypothetical protein GCM10011378_16220 [Hymenobacter glacieicola]
MSKLQQEKVPAARPVAAAAARAGSPPQATPLVRQAARGLVTGVLLGVGAVGATWLSSCSDDKARRPDAELQTSRPAATPAEVTTAEGTPDDATQPFRASGQYLVVAETAYFFSSPEQAKSTGRYLLRGDVVHGEEERGGFVKTRFKTPNGAIVAGWLKTNELSRLSNCPTTAATRPAQPTRPVPQPETSNSEDTYSYEIDPAPTATPAPDRAVGPQTAVVQVARSYFYHSSDLTQPRKAHCVQGDKVRLGEERGEAVYVRFTNWEKVTTTGWMRKDALRYSQ